MSGPIPQRAEMPTESSTNSTLAVQEEALLQRALAGDGRAFAQLVSPHLPVLYRIAGRAIRDDGLAEDAVQEALVVAHRQLSRYRAGTSLRGYLAAIAVRRAQTLLRGEIRRRAREEKSARPAEDSSTEEVVVAEEQRQRLLAAIDRLPTKRKEAVLLRLDGGLSHAEIAAAVGSTERSVRVLVHLGLKELKANLERDNETRT